MISTKGRYALRLMIDLARQGKDAKTPLREVSQRQGISVKYLEQLVSSLVSAGLLKSVRGAHGGYVIVRPFDEITAGDILRAAEGSTAPVACLEEGTQHVCLRRHECETIAFWAGLERAIDEYVDSVKLSDLIAGPKR
ncbi:MAG: RrF2 family transcriptional regulator [Anaerotardibacter sp.]